MASKMRAGFILSITEPPRHASAGQHERVVDLNTRLLA